MKSYKIGLVGKLRVNKGRSYYGDMLCVGHIANHRSHVYYP